MADIENKSISLIDIDTDINLFLKDSINPSILENGKDIPVPILYADTEKWNLILKNKPIYDKKGKLLLPLLLFRRNPDVSINDQYPKLNLRQHSPENMFYINESYSNRRTYTDARFGLSTFITSSDLPKLYLNRPELTESAINLKEKKILKYLRIPTHITLTYTIIFYTRFIEHSNKLIEKIISYHNTAFGNKFRHAIKINSIAPEVSVEIDTDRIIKTQIELGVNSILLGSEYNNKPNILNKPNITGIEVIFTETEI